MPSIRSRCSKNYAILPHQMLTLLFYHIILQYLIYQMFYNSILYIKIIFTTHQHNKQTTNNIPHIFRTVANLPRYCSMLQKKKQYPTSTKWTKIGFGVGYVPNM